jgi:hypothetical protein
MLTVIVTSYARDKTSVILCSCVMSVGSIREAAAGREGDAERHPLQSSSHDQRQEVPPQDLQVCVFFTFARVCVVCTCFVLLYGPCKLSHCVCFV